MINWRNIKEVGYPTEDKKYLVTDGKDISTSTINGIMNFKKDGVTIFKFTAWQGDDNTYEDNDCCSGTKVFDMNVTHWCPVNELNLPIAN